MNPGREAGDRAAFLHRLERRLASGIPTDPAHPVPGPVVPLPVATPTALDTADLALSFEQAAAAVHTRVHPVAGTAAFEAALDRVVREHGIASAAVSREPAAQALLPALGRLGVRVLDTTVGSTASADAGVTGAVAGIAATGTVVLDAAACGGRSVWLLPPTHVVVLSVADLVATPADHLRRFGPGSRLPSNLCLVTGPSRSGDIEQIIVEGVHGPTAVHVLLRTDAPPTIPHRSEPTGLDDARCPTPEGDP